MKEIFINQIEVSKKQSRKSFNDEKLKQLAESMKVEQIHPIIVYPEDNKYILVAGWRRLKAAKDFNKAQKIKAEIIPYCPEKIFYDQVHLIENIQREDLNIIDKAFAIKEFIEKNKINQTKAAKLLSLKQRTISSWLTITKINKKYYKDVINENLKLTYVNEAIRIRKVIDNPGKVNELLDAVLEHNLTRKEIRHIIDLHKEYFNISTQEAVGVILVQRGDEKPARNNRYNNIIDSQKIIKALSKISNNIDKYIEQNGKLKQTDNQQKIKKHFIDITEKLNEMISNFDEIEITEKVSSRC